MLTQSKGLDIAFTGEMLGEASDRWQEGIERSRWYDMRLFRTDGGRYVLWEKYNTSWKRERGSENVEVFEDARELEDYLVPDCDELQGVIRELLEESAFNDQSLIDIKTWRVA